MSNRRVQLTALTAVGALIAGVALALVAQSPSYAAADTFAVAPYADMSNSQAGMLDTAITQHGLKAYSAAFVIGAGCNQTWGDTLPVGNDPYIDPEIARAKSEGASVIISSGGAGGEPLAWTCTTQSSIESGYQNIIDSYDVDWLDFDVEGAAVADPQAATRHMQAMKDLKAANPGLKFSMTLPVMPSGLTADGVNIIRAAQTAQLTIDVVNVMAMDYYQGQQDMGQAAIDAATHTLAQLKTVNPAYTYANVGITPMIGVNDDHSVFTFDDALQVHTWAKANGIGRLAFWSVNRDQPCPGGPGGGASPLCSGVSDPAGAFVDAFVAGTVTPPSSPPTTPPGSCTAPAWNASTAYTGGNEVSYNGHTWKAKWWTKGETPSTGGTGVWTDEGPCDGGPPTTPPPTTPPPTTPPPPGGAGAFRVAPYIDITRPTPTLAQAAQASGQKYYTLAFVLGSSSGCDPSWGGTIALDDPGITGQIGELRALGGDVAVSFGGAAGPYLSSVCTTQSALATAYENVIDTLNVKHLDFDVEASVPIDTMMRAIAQVQRERPGTTAQFTLMVQASSYGLTPALGVDLLNTAANDGVQVSIVNPMLMDYGQTQPDWGQDVIMAAEAVHAQLSQIWPDRSSEQLYAMLGGTPMIGRNDTGPTFSIADANSFIGWANEHHIGYVGFWSVGRDNGDCPGGGVSPACSGIAQSPYQFTGIFEAFAG